MEAFQTQTFSPRELARIVGVSESSIKRWVDDGLIAVIRTAGGHRRIMASEALRFIRHQGMRVLRPDLLGFTGMERLPEEAREGRLDGELLFQLLHDGDADRAKGAITNAYLQGMPLAELFDGPVAQAMARIGALWEHGPAGIFIEHAATVVCLEAVGLLRSLFAPPRAGAPIALGGAPEGDPYMLPTLMVATVLAELGFRDVNLGANTPPGAFLQAVEARQPALVWLSVSTPDEEGLVERLRRELLEPLSGVKTPAGEPLPILAGGRTFFGVENPWPASVQVLPDLASLVAIAGPMVVTAISK